jgi:hypothetical protein
MDFDYSDIKYYGDEDFAPAIARLLAEPTTYRIGRYLNSNTSDEQVKEYLLSFKDNGEFQINFILQIIKKLIAKSMLSLTSNGAEDIDINGDKKYVFITNHRNIVMDASILNHELHRFHPENFEATAIAIGNNLLKIPWVKDLARLNKSFVVIRDSSVQQMLENSKKLSNYMRHLIVENKSSVWIAQREGRAKDGNDLTQPGLLKMFQMSGENDFVKNYAELNIIPVAISYEHDPCIREKVREIASIENTGAYVKSPMDDFNSMYNGLMGPKGRVHLSYGKQITEDDLSEIDASLPRNEKIKRLAEIVDDFIHTNYKLWPSNYIATDLLNESTQFASHYTSEEKNKFETFADTTLADIEGNLLQNKSIFLKMYANPVKNCHKKNSDFAFNF